MRWTRAFIHTQRHDPAEAEVVSHRLMVRAAMIHKVAAGIYTYLPLGWRSLAKLEAIVREEMAAAGATELSMPSVQPAQLWQESGRWEQYGPELLRLSDRHQRDFCFGPTHEEVMTETVRRVLKSYRQLPLNLYQIQTKFRDEIRPRFGLMRGREFIMKDAYSFDADSDGLDQAYRAMEQAYRRIFERCGLRSKQVEADTGNIGGSESHEFMVTAETGEDAILSCTNCGYGANVEKARHGVLPPTSPWPLPADPAPTKRSTPEQRTVEDVAAFSRARTCAPHQDPAVRNRTWSGRRSDPRRPGGQRGQAAQRAQLRHFGARLRRVHPAGHWWTTGLFRPSGTGWPDGARRSHGHGAHDGRHWRQHGRRPSGGRGSRARLHSR